MITVTEQSFLNELKEKKIDFHNLNKLLVEKLKEKNLKVATAESCTGGLISKKITELSGASAVFDCGVCSYSNQIKERVLGVDKNILDTLGAVSAEVAMQMSDGVKKLSDSDVAISTTGIAGPTGDTPEKPVGLVYIGVSVPQKTFAVKALFCKDKHNAREQVRVLSANYAMYALYQELSEK